MTETSDVGERLARIEQQLAHLPELIGERIDHTDRNLRQLLEGLTRDQQRAHDVQTKSDQSVAALWRKVDNHEDLLSRVITVVEKFEQLDRGAARIHDLRPIDERLARLEDGWTDADGQTIPQQVAANTRMVQRARWIVTGAAFTAGLAGSALAGPLMQLVGA